MGRWDEDNSREIPLSWFGRTLWKHTPLYVELVFLAACLRLIGLVEPFIFQVGFEALSELLGLLTANRVTREFGARIFNHLFRLPRRHFRKWSVGETDTIRNFLVGMAAGALLDLLFVVVYLGVLLALSVSLTLIVLAALPFQFAVYFAFGPFLRRRLRVQFDAGATHQSRMVENISGIAAVKAVCAEGEMLKRLDETLGLSLRACYRVGILNIFSDRLIFVMERGVTIAILFVGAHLIFKGQITLGELIAFHLLAEKVTDPISGFSGLWESWQNIKVSRQRLGDIVNVPTEPFGDRPKLPPGLDTPSAGRVTLGGEDIAERDPNDVRAAIAYIPQEPCLFSGTLRENLLIGKAGASDVELEEALDVAAAGSLAIQLPLGLGTDVGERGAALSGG